MPVRILIAPDKFKGALTGNQAAEAIASGIRNVLPEAALDLCPIADGGEGFMATLAPALQGKWISCPSVDALGREIESCYLLAETRDGRVAVIEMAETSGLWRLQENERDPMLTHTRGVGKQMLHAIQTYHVDKIVLGIGGSATNDGGCGMAQELGYHFLDAAGRELDATPAALASLTRIDASEVPPLPAITVACDVDNPLLGERGATAVFSTQKGSTEETRPLLEAFLNRLVQVTGANDASLDPGAGAAGGLGFGLLHFTSARLVPGFDLLARLLDLKGRVAAADIVITGEGSIDHQSLSGKGPVGIARMGRAHGKTVVGFCGLADQAARDSGEFDFLVALADTGKSIPYLISHAADELAIAAAQPDLYDPDGRSELRPVGAR
ncbi:glycerate kinase [Haloferula luteola]|uniref:Glycerate kinase n=1 Tax=Haloferula luteola TaxID=595692 RepID=A0A840VDB7_9BACT|nr:glycerate kinase [Haloferula luteola]MBB5351880.1 glycerate kinase [Haloferula luteola]